ncbi:MAG TPA: hypothetical protein VFO77_10500 [Actinoplanes sp.]|nr:hypothetical protein [Actinoplanes sp.]
MASTDPRTRLDGLGVVCRAVFGDSRLRLAVHPHRAAPPVADAAATIRYAVTPSLDHPRLLVPLVSRVVRAASTVTYHALRPARARLRHSPGGAGSGGNELARLPILTVTVPAGVDPDEVLPVELLTGPIRCRSVMTLGGLSSRGSRSV